MNALKKLYRRDMLSVHQIAEIVESSLQEQKGIALIRIGDALAKILNRSPETLERVSSFLGIPFPPTEAFYTDLERAVNQCRIIGVSHCPFAASRIHRYMRSSGWGPEHMTDSFINDQLYSEGYLHEYMRNYRTALVGRAAPAAAEQLAKQGINVAYTAHLDHYHELDQVLDQLQKHANHCELFLVGASVPGRILCVKIANRFNKPALEIGHMMDALAVSFDPSKTFDRMSAKNRWVRNHSDRTKED